MTESERDRKRIAVASDNLSEIFKRVAEKAQDHEFSDEQFSEYLIEMEDLIEAMLNGL